LLCGSGKRAEEGWGSDSNARIILRAADSFGRFKLLVRHEPLSGRPATITKFKSRAAATTAPEKPEADEGYDFAPSSDLDAVHKEAVENYTAGWTKDRENQAAAYDDLRFLADAEEDQWEEKAKKDREAEGDGQQVSAILPPGDGRHPADASRNSYRPG
jgi:hypothetical protein